MAWERGIRIAFVPSWGYYIHDSGKQKLSLGAGQSTRELMTV
jgi:hypothetical protein